MSQTTEKAFETHVEEILLGQSGWKSGTNAEWDKERALFPARIFAFLQDTQAKLWEEMRNLHGSGLESILVASLVKELDLKGTLHVLRHGFKFYGKTFRLAYFKPAHGLNWEVIDLYGKNQLTITRQTPCHSSDNSTVDMVFAVNGVPVATCELKNPGTGQSWRSAVNQYREDRDPRAPLFQFKSRALVPFAADPDEVHMTTRLAKEQTHFLPFNRGSHPGEIQCGAGNPQHPSGYRTGYFWEEVLQRDSFLDILGHFMFIAKRRRSRPRSEQNPPDSCSGVIHQASRRASHSSPQKTVKGCIAIFLCFFAFLWQTFGRYEQPNSQSRSRACRLYSR